MKNNEAVRIAIAETSVIIRGGLTAALKRLSNVKVQPIELLSVEALHDCVRTQCPEMLIVNPAFGDYFDVAKFREEISGKRIRLIALVTSFVDASLLKYFLFFNIFSSISNEGFIALQHVRSVDLRLIICLFQFFKLSIRHYLIFSIYTLPFQVI